MRIKPDDLVDCLSSSVQPVVGTADKTRVVDWIKALRTARSSGRIKGVRTKSSAAHSRFIQRELDVQSTTFKPRKIRCLVQLGN